MAPEFVASGTPTTQVVLDGATCIAGFGSDANGDPSQFNCGPLRVVLSVDAAGQVVSVPVALGLAMVSMSEPTYVTSVVYTLTPMIAKSAVTAILG